jgi:eukaryotic-like serine/threonine-protein kinase
MSDSVSDARNAQSSPAPGDANGRRAEEGSASGVRPIRRSNDEPTIVSNRPPIASPSTSDSSYRILEGRVMPGDRLGDFELVEYVGGGGMGRVFRAIDTRLGRSVALKVLPPEQAADPDSLQRFQNEAQSAARLAHDNIAGVHYVGEDRGLHYIVFEFVEGVNVRRLVEQKGPLPLADVISYTIQAADALAHAAARSIVHRDIKPSNMLITAEGRVKLIDMGLARLRHADPAAGDLTASGVTLGTFDYISPEQARDPRNADIRSDIYSLGCTVFFMLVGQPPFPDGTVLQKLLQHQGDQPPDVRRFRPELPEEASRILRKMMAKDPRQRYANAADLVAELIALAEQIGLQPMSPTGRIWLAPRAPSVSFFRRHVGWMATVATFIGIMLVLDWYWSLPPRRDEPQRSRSIVGAPSSPSEPQLASPENPPADEDHRQPIANGKKSVSSSPGEPSEMATPSPDSTAAEEGENSSKHRTADRATEAAGGTEANHAGPSATAENASPSNMAAPVESSPPQVATATHAPAPPSETLAPPETQAKRAGVLLVGDSSANGENAFPTLEAACAAAHNGDVIELHFDGPQEERPIRISNLRLTIRAGEGHHPVVVFRPNEGNPVKYPRNMLTVTAGRLTLSNVAMELHVPRELRTDNWSLLETLGGQTLRLERCWLTVFNASDQFGAYHENVAFLRARSAGDSEAAVGVAPAATPLATIELTDCIARGEAVFLRVEDLQPVQLLWDNGLLVTTEQLLSAPGGPVAPKLDDMLHLELRHVTAAVHGRLCRLTSTPSNPYQLAVQFICTDSILLTATGVPLIEQEGAASVESFRQRFIWRGDRNYYEDIDAFWTVHSGDPDAPPDVMNFDTWKTYWGESRENQPSTERLAWKKPPDVGRPLHVYGPADYTLEDPPVADAAAGPPGFRADQLPQVLPDAAPEKQPRSGSPREAAAERRAEKG